MFSVRRMVARIRNSVKKGAGDDRYCSGHILVLKIHRAYDWRFFFTGFVRLARGVRIAHRGGVYLNC